MDVVIAVLSWLAGLVNADQSTAAILDKIQFDLILNQLVALWG